MTLSLSEKILAYLNSFPLGLTFAQIYDAVKPDSYTQLSVVRNTAKAVYELSCDGLICCNELFNEAFNGSARERDVLYKVSQRGKMHLFGLVLLSANKSSTQTIFDSNGAVAQGKTGEKTSTAEQEPSKLRVAGSNPASPSKFADAPNPSTGIGGNGAAPEAFPLLPPSLIQTETDRVNRVMDAVNRVAVADVELCDCGRPAKKVCACGKQTCATHWYDADGNHTLSDKDGMCSECVAAVEMQTWGESLHGIAGRQ